MSTENRDDPRDFALILMEIGKGRLHARLSDQLAAVAAGVAETGKKGTVTLKIEVKPPSKNAESGVLSVTGISTATVPESDSTSPTSIFFVGDSGNLTRNDPKQLMLPMSTEKERA